MQFKRRRVQTVIEGDSMTKQAFAADADVNTIVSRHMRGVGRNLSNIGAGGTRQPIFGDFSSVSYHEMLNAVTDIDNIFRRLPARIRGKFRNDPYQVIRYCEDPANLREAVKLGLMSLPEGMAMTEEGDVIDQVDLVDEAARKQPEAPVEPDDEAQPKHSGSR